MIFASADAGFKQEVREVQNTFLENPVMISVLEIYLRGDVLSEISPDLVQICERANNDELLVTEAWSKQKETAAREGVVAIAYERKFGQYSRIYQMAKLILWTSRSGLSVIREVCGALLKD
ncbi:hypothetical protein BGZ75_002733 [Mortierella antarctica]|nr:hypothetical protein BGZ75_002733 [Mortierella antarctica]